MTAYNEIYDETGAMRPAYAAIRARTGTDVTKPGEKTVSVLCSGALVSDRSISPVPLVLDDAEYQSMLVPGVLQRAFVLQALFEDIAIGPRRLLDLGILCEHELEWILNSEGTGSEPIRRMWKDQSREQIRFVYAPDLVRNPAGNWVALEDNVGCVGGIARGIVTHDAYLKTTELLPGMSHNSSNDLERAVEAFLSHAGVASNTSGLYGFAGWTSSCGGDLNNFETAWKADCLRSMGVYVTQPEDLLGWMTSGVVNPSAIVNLSATTTSGFQELAEISFTANKTPMMGSPCVGVIASKSFLAFDEALATEYLGEQRIIRSASSRLIREPHPKLPNEGVLKRSNGCQGNEVFFLDEIRDDIAHANLLASLDDWGPCSAILQEQIKRSILDGNGIGSMDSMAVEIRPIVYVYGWQKALVGEVVSARAIPANGERRGNISRGAALLPVLREAVNQKNDI